jgi:hypothetical protein
MADDSKSPKGTFPNNIVSDPKHPPDLAIIAGFLGESSEDDHVRVYSDPQLSQYIEVPKKAIAFRHDLAPNASPLGGSYIWVKKDAEITCGRADGVRWKTALTPQQSKQTERGTTMSNFPTPCIPCHPCVPPPPCHPCLPPPCHPPCVPPCHPCVPPPPPCHPPCVPPCHPCVPPPCHPPCVPACHPCVPPPACHPPCVPPPACHPPCVPPPACGPCISI